MLIYTMDSEVLKTRIVIKITLKVRKEERRVKALVDSGAKANYIKRRLVIEINILVI